MKELDNNFIEAFAAQYWNQEVIMVKDYDDLMTIMDFSLGAKCFDYEIEYINLRSIDDLTDEECIEGAKILGEPHPVFFKSFAERLKGNLYITENRYLAFNLLNAIDFLKEKGFAISFRGVNVKTMILSGKIKLRK